MLSHEQLVPYKIKYYCFIITIIEKKQNKKNMFSWSNWCVSDDHLSFPSNTTFCRLNAGGPTESCICKKMHLKCNRCLISACERLDRCLPITIQAEMTLLQNRRSLCFSCRYGNYNYRLNSICLFCSMYLCLLLSIRLCWELSNKKSRGKMGGELLMK